MFVFVTFVHVRVRVCACVFVRACLRVCAYVWFASSNSYSCFLQHLAFKRRQAELRKYVADTPYAVRKSRLCSSLEDFLRARSIPGAS